MLVPVTTCPRCGSPHLSSQASGAICLTCLSRRLLERDHEDVAALDFSAARDVSASPLPATVAVPDQLGAYEILEELGRGGMGIVYSARHKDLDRVVALKVIRRGEWATTEDEARFLREAQAAARLRHPGIVTIFDVGRHGTWSFYAMEYLEGGDLAQFLARGEVPVRRAAEIIAAVAPAIAHAHALGIVHRDLKPSNILLDEHGAPHVADFGLARWTQESAELTRTGMIIGSPAYMAPEQATGAANAASDVYGLGAILHFLLTGKPPHGGGAAEVLARAARDDAPPPSAQRREVPPELDAICRRALARDPAQRYVDATALGDDLRAWLEGRSVSAPLSGPTEARRQLESVKSRLRKEGIEPWNYASLVDEITATTRIDPTLVEGWALECRTHCTIVDFFFDTSDTRRELARAALARAQALDPRHPATRSAAGSVAASIDGNLDEALRLFREVAAEFPQDHEIAFRCGRLARRMGFWREGNLLMAQAARATNSAYDRGVTSFGYYAVRDFPNALALIDEAVRQDPTDYQRRCFQIWFRWQRDPLPSRRLQEIRALPPEMRKLRDVAWVECQFLFAESRFTEALAVYRAAPATMTEEAVQVIHEHAFELRLARLANDPSAAEVERELRARLAPGRLPVDLSPQQHGLLANTYAVLGDAAAYHRHADPLLASVKISTLDGARRHGHNEFFAAPGKVLNLALLGENEAALAAVARVLNVPGAIDVRTLAFEPAFAALRADPRFDALIAQAQFPITAQDGPDTLDTAALPLPRIVPSAETEARGLLDQARHRVLSEGILQQNVEAITDALSRATQLAPGLAGAWGLLARIHLAWWGSGGDTSDARRELGIAALGRGESLDARDPDVRSARAGFLSQIERKRTEAFGMYREIVREHPQLVFHQMAYARACWSIGHWRTGNAALLQCARLQPEVGQYLQLVGYGCAVVRDFRNAVTWLEAACRVDPKPLWRRLGRAWYRWQLDPVPEPLLARYEEWFTPEERKTDLVAWFAAQLHLARGDPAAARAAFLTEDPPSKESTAFGGELAFRYRLEKLAGLPSAPATADKLRALLAPGRMTAAQNPQRYIQIAFVNAVLGHRDETLAHIASAAALCQPDEYSVRPRILGHNEFSVPCGQLMLLALIGETERCLDELDRWINYPFAVDLRCLATDPAFAAIRANPRFAAIMARAQMPIEFEEPADGSPPVFPR